MWLIRSRFPLTSDPASSSFIYDFAVNNGPVRLYPLKRIRFHVKQVFGKYGKIGKFAGFKRAQPVFYAYDALNRPVSMEQDNRLASVSKENTVLAEFLYDSRGRRTLKQTDAGTIVYHYYLNGNLIAESDDAGTVQKT